MADHESSKTDTSHQPETPPQKRGPEAHVGILKESDKKKLEAEIISKLQHLGSELTKKDIRELLAAIETSKSLGALREKIVVSQEKNDGKLTEQLLNELIALAEQIRRGAAEGIRELRIDVRQVLQNPPVHIRKGVFVSERFPILTKLEKTELGENIVVDIAWFTVWALDSILAIAELILRLLSDAVRLPWDLLKRRG